MVESNKIMVAIAGWAKNTNVSYKKIADYFGVNKNIVKEICLRERQWEREGNK